MLWVSSCAPKNAWKLIEDILLFSLAARGEFTLNKELVNIKDLIRVSISRVEKLAVSRKIKLETFLPTELPLILVDPEKISWVIIQLLENAIKFTPSGGEISLSAQLHNDSVVFSVEDNGVGISPADLPRIFERFYKADRARSGGGTGLGLAISRHLVEAHSGKIWAASTEGQGSIFYFSLPLAN